MWRGLLGRGEGGEDFLAVALQLRRAHTRYRRQLGERARAALGDLLQRRIVEDQVGRHLIRLRPLEAPLLERPEGRRQLLFGAAGRRLAPGLHAELGEEAAWPARPRQGEVLACPRDAHVEQAALFADRRIVSECLLARELALLDPRQEDGVPLEALGAVQRQQVHAALGAVVEALAEPLDPVADMAGAVVELLGEPDQPCKVALARRLALPRARRRRLLPPVLASEPPHFVSDRARGRASESFEELPCCVARQERRALEGDLRVAEGFLEVGRTGVQANENRHLLERRAGRMQLTDTLDDELSFGVVVREAAQLRLGTGTVGLAQLLLGPAETWNEAVGEPEHLRCGAVVRLQPDDCRIREPLGQRQEVLRRR